MAKRAPFVLSKLFTALIRPMVPIEIKILLAAGLGVIFFHDVRHKAQVVADKPVARCHIASLKGGEGFISSFAESGFGKLLDSRCSAKYSMCVAIKPRITPNMILPLGAVYAPTGEEHAHGWKAPYSPRRHLMANHAKTYSTAAAPPKEENRGSAAALPLPGGLKRTARCTRPAPPG